MAGRSFADHTRELDDAIDRHLSDPMTLIVDGTRIPLPGTHVVEEFVASSEGSQATVVERRISVQERLLPTRLVERRAVIERADPYHPEKQVTIYRVREVKPRHSGRADLILGTTS